jgi:flagella basal body P-ring formation protein FlgA
MMFLPIQAAEIRLKNVPVHITEPLVTLADIADVLPMGNENVDPLRQTVLFLTPADGGTRTLDQWELRTMLAQLGVNSLHHFISGAEQITVVGVAERPAPRVNPNEQFVIQANHLTPTGTNPVTPIAARSDVSPPVAGLTDDIARLLERQVAQALGIYLNFTHRIERSWDVSLQRVDRINGDDFFVDIQSVVGREIVRPVRELTPLTQSSIRMPFWVRRGEIVTVRAAKNGIVVRTEAIAQQDGVEGDTITVEKIDLNSTRRGGQREAPVTYLARVAAPKTVEVFVK